jgi:hypothetical protein
VRYVTAYQRQLELYRGVRRTEGKFQYRHEMLQQLRLLRVERRNRPVANGSRAADNRSRAGWTAEPRPARISRRAKPNKRRASAAR